MTVAISDSSEYTISTETKDIECWCVRVKKVVPKDRKASRLILKDQIECGRWSFLCPDYKYSHIRDGLINAIKEVLDVEDVELRSFMTGIVEYDETDTERLC